MIAAGLLVSLLLPDHPWRGHIIGAVVGYGLLRGIAWGYRHWRGVDGLGMGDAKLLAAAGAWLGWEALPSVILIGSLSALLVAFGLHLARRPLTLTSRLPFGPALALGFWSVWLWGSL